MRSRLVALLPGLLPYLRGVYEDVSTDRRRASVGQTLAGDAVFGFSAETVGICGIVVEDPLRLFPGGEVRTIEIFRASSPAVASATVGL